MNHAIKRRIRASVEIHSPARPEQGFTLVELVVAMVILAVLAAIAIPSYTNYVLKSHRTEAKSTLLDAASLEERYYSTANTYTSNPSDLGYGTGTVTPFPIGSGYYNITSIQANAAIAPSNGSPGGTPASYTITAAAVGNQTRDTQCPQFQINSAGRQTAPTSPDPSGDTDCWQK